MEVHRTTTIKLFLKFLIFLNYYEVQVKEAFVVEYGNQPEPVLDVNFVKALFGLFHNSRYPKQFRIIQKVLCQISLRIFSSGKMPE